MAHSKRNTKLILGTVLVVLGIAVFIGLNLLFAKKVKQQLQQLPPSMELRYGDLDANALWGNINMTDVSFQKQNSAQEPQLSINTPKIEVNGIGLLRLLWGGKIYISQIYLDTPKISYFPNSNTETPKQDSQMDRTFELGSLKVDHAQIRILKKDSEQPQFRLDSLNLQLDHLVMDSTTITSPIPFTYTLKQLEGQRLWLDMGPYEALSVDEITAGGKDWSLTNFHLFSKYDKRTLSQKLPYERDHYDFTIPKLSLLGLDIASEENRPKIHLDQVMLQDPTAHIFRDKLLPDDLRHKKLFGAMLRGLSVKLEVPQLLIHNGYLTYEERLEPNIVPEKLWFGKIQANIHQLQNLSHQKVAVRAEAMLMGEGDLQLNWSFDPLQKPDYFTAWGQLTNFETKAINPFLRTNMGAEISGRVDELYFTFTAGPETSKGDMKMKYQNFDFKVLQKDRSGVNKLISAVVGLFTNDGSKTDENGYRYGTIKGKRDDTKSFFNYLWVSINDGLVSTLTGNGKKED